MQADHQIAEGNTLSVTMFTHRVRHLLEEEAGLSNVWIRGEISQFTLHASGHAYFTLKDEGACLSCVKFKSYFGEAQERYNVGEQVVVCGALTVYAARGSYQLKVSSIRRAGTGNIYEEFMRLKIKLEAEGLFDSGRKKPIPAAARRVGIVSSRTGAVIQDIRATIERRYAGLQLYLAPALMQGNGCSESVIEGMERLCALKHIEVVIIARGGGSPEDLCGFNDERLVRYISGCHLPVISAVGHETDFSLCDFVADARAATPTAAAEMISRDAAAMRALLKEAYAGINRRISRKIDDESLRLDNAEDKLRRLAHSCLTEKEVQLNLLNARLQAHDPALPITRGYTLTTRSNGKRLNGSEKTGEEIITYTQAGALHSTITKVETGKKLTDI